MELINHEHQSLDASRTVRTLVSSLPVDLPPLPPRAAPNGWNYRGRPWAYLDAPSSHCEVGVSSALTPPSTRETIAVLVDCPHEPQFLPDMAVPQSAFVAAGRAMHQAWPFTQKDEVQGNLELVVADKQLLPWGYGNDYSAAVMDQMKAAFCSLNVEQRENPPMPTGDVTPPPECPRARCYNQTSGELSGCPVVTARVAETTCQSQVTPCKTGSADRKLQQLPVIQLPKLEGRGQN